MARPTLAVLLLLLGGVPFTVAPKVNDVPVLLHELPTGTLEVSESGGQPTAIASAIVDGHRVVMESKCRLLWKGEFHSSDMNVKPHHFTDTEKACFQFKSNSAWGLSEAGKFMRALYFILGKDVPPKAASQLAFCKTRSGLLVGIGLVKDGRLITGFENSFLLSTSLNQGATEKGPPSLPNAPAWEYKLPSGRYRAARRDTGEVWSTVPLLTSFEMEIWNHDGQQVAKLGTTVANKSFETAEGVPVSRCYSDRKRSPDFSRYGLRAGKSEGCFCFVEDKAREAFNFVCKLYGAMGEPIPKQRKRHHLVICGTSSVILIGLKVETNKGGRLLGFSDTIFLEGPLTSTVGGKVSGSVTVKQTSSSDRKRKGSPGVAVPAKRRYVKKYNPVVEDQLASGTYRAKKQGGVCPTLPSLTGFEVEVSQSDGQQVATVNAQVGSQRMRVKSSLAWSSDGDDNSRGLPETAGRCFLFKANRGYGISAAGKFIRGLYSALKMQEPSRAAAKIALCSNSTGLVVVLGPEWERGHVVGAEHSFLLEGPFESQTAEKKLPEVLLDPVAESEVPSGTYKAIKPDTSGVCPTLPLLDDFHMTVWEDGGRQVATLNATANGEVVRMKEGTPLVWPSLQKYGLPKTGAKRCFHFLEKSSVNDFMRKLYTAMDEARSSSSLAFCHDPPRLLVGIGIVKTGHGRVHFENTFYLARPESNAANDVGGRGASSPPDGSEDQEQVNPAEEKPSDDIAGSAAADSSDLFPEWLSDDDEVLDLARQLATAPDLDLSWMEGDSYPPESIYSPLPRGSYNDNTIDEEENRENTAGPWEAVGSAADGNSGLGLWSLDEALSKFLE
ncbi:hypothetical protein FOZ63_002932 [Perkinsus olseni]|uniref:Uncharacterized protein n=1 Tax=Perkinsus olseni TaxID=32597 RepID=A0A7J6S1T0_PEROL|nr:hypothetical protein FOZ62_018732 [Perkinsus olseni]KAF4726924.1 hypothetical protein FOZ63_002932 [Perkinsus olseni]